MKTKRILSAAAGALLSTAVLLAFAPASQAQILPPTDLVYQVSINVSSLDLNSNQPFSLDLQLVTGSGNVTNVVRLYNFSFTGGSPSGTPDYTNGGETGSLAAGSGVALTNSASDNEFAEAFSSGVTNISFRVDETTNSEVVGSGTPIDDQFNIAILDNGLNNIPTTDPSGGSTLVSSTIFSNMTLPSVNTYSSESPDGGVTVSLVAAPEPGCAELSFMAAGVMLLVVLGLRHRRQA
ncbi:MAG TPA: hypothetical protein VL981_09525 [Candidatus Methylacidiphilales bacterium]|nr:hypothetical protein [Candidatus Methylacidiphilales bacterium]